MSVLVSHVLMQYLLTQPTHQVHCSNDKIPTPELLLLHNKKEDENIVNICINNDGYGRRCQNKRLPHSLYCARCWMIHEV